MKVTVSVNYEDSEISLSNADLEKVAKLMESRSSDLAKKVSLVHRKSVFQILTYAIRICNVATGRLRGGFTPYMRKYGYTNFEAYMATAPIGGKPPKQPGQPFDATAAEAGADEGSFIDQAMNTVISNNVLYAAFVDAKTGLIARILDRGQAIYASNFQNFFDALAKKNGAVPPVNPNSGQED